MAAPWEKYDSAPAKGKPWERYAAPEYGTGSAESRQSLLQAEQQSARSQMSHAATTAESIMQGKDPYVDYKTGVPDASLTAELSLLTKSEQKNLLDKKYGAENVSTDFAGNWFIKPGAYEKAGVPKPPKGDITKGTAVIPKERWTVPRVTSFAGEVAPTAGSAVGGMIGAAAGAPAGPGGATVGGIGGAALGGGFGESVNALIAQGLGMADRTTGEQQKMIAYGMAGGALGEGLGRFLPRIGRAALGPYAEFAPSSPEHLATLRRTLDMGLVPRIGAAQPKSFLMPREQGLIEAIFGFGPEKKNIEILTKEGEKLVQQTGGKPAVSQTEIVKAAQKKMDDLALGVNTARNKADQMLNESIQNIQSKMGKVAPMEVQRDIEASYKTFQDEASGLYSKVDEMIGGRKVVPTDSVRKAAQSVLDGLPKTREGKPLYDPEGVAIQFLRNLTQLPDRYSFGEMQALRSQLASSAEVKSLLASTGARNAEILRQAASDSFDMVGQALRGKANKATDALRKADDFYRQGMEKFDLPIVRKLMLDARESGSVPTERVLQLITMPNSATNIARVMNLVTPETRSAIRRAHFDSMVANSTDSLTGKISGVKLAQEINKLKTTFPALYGRDGQTIKTLAQQLAALDGKIDPAALKSGNMSSAIRQAITAEKQFKAMSEDELFSALSKPGFESAQAVDHLFKPGHPERITRAIKFFGENSQEAKNIRALAMTKLIRAMEFTKETRTGVKHELSGKQLEDALKMYGRPTIEAMFGKDLARNLYEFASVSEMATAKNPQLSTIAGAAMVFHPLSHVTKLAELFTFGHVMTNPKFIKWLTEGYRFPPPMARGVRALTRAAAYEAAIRAEQPGIGGPTELDKELEAVMVPQGAALGQPNGAQQQ